MLQAQTAMARCSDGLAGRAPSVAGCGMFCVSLGHLGAPLSQVRPGGVGRRSARPFGIDDGTRRTSAVSSCPPAQCLSDRTTKGRTPDLAGVELGRFRCHCQDVGEGSPHLTRGPRPALHCRNGCRACSRRDRSRAPAARRRHSEFRCGAGTRDRTAGDVLRRRAASSSCWPVAHFVRSSHARIAAQVGFTVVTAPQIPPPFAVPLALSPRDCSGRNCSRCACRSSLTRR
jgi:hypothetical protein